MTKDFSLLGFVAELGAIERDMHAAGPMIIEKACRIIQKKAKTQIGKPHPGIWEDLAPSTISDKERKGFATPKPLLRTGELRDLIEYKVDGLQGAVGSDLDIAYWQELGTKHIPPRSFLVSSAIASEDRIHRMATATTIAAFSGYGRHAGEAREIIELFHRAGHALRELGEDLLDPDEDERSDK